MKFAIVDVGGWVTGEITPAGLKIEGNCGTPAKKILRGMRFFHDPHRMAESMLRRWVTGRIRYDGGYEGGWPAAIENQLYVCCDNTAGYASAIALAPR